MYRILYTTANNTYRILLCVEHDRKHVSKIGTCKRRLHTVKYNSKRRRNTIENRL